MRSRVDKPTTIPLKYRRYRRDDWPGGWGQFVREREEWARNQPPVVMTGVTPFGLSWRTVESPLGGITDFMRMRREARMIDSGVESG